MTHPRIPAGHATHLEPEVVTLPQAPGPLNHLIGPWQYTLTSYTFEVSSPTVGIVLRQRSGMLPRPQDARLIAAAPELLAACQAVEATQRALTYAEAFDAVRAAIARATGE